MTRTSPRLALLAAVVAAVLLASCSSSSGGDASDKTTTTAKAATTTEPKDTSDTTEPDTKTTDPGDGEEAEEGDICVPLKVLSDFDAESYGLINGGDWEAAQTFFVENTDDVLAAYDDAIAMDTDLADELQQLRDVTDTTAETAADSADLAEFSTKLMDQPGIMEAGGAGYALNNFAEETCGFSTGNQGS